jgi:hypothetical protein
MPLQNRVSPWGELEDDPSKAGTIMGNRGVLHDKDKNIVRQWLNKEWKACVPQFKGIDRKPLFQEKNYSELFFLDEATAYASGHRPCCYCQRVKYKAFKLYWATTHRDEKPATEIPIKEIDKILHQERIGSGGVKVKYAASLATLPEGTIFEVDEKAFLLYRGRILRWSFTGYSAAEFGVSETEVNVLTPRSIVDLYAAGLKPDVHPSADVLIDNS